jgi:acylphosphatase
MDPMGAGHEICRRVVVFGQVQGVFFRDSLREQAESAGVAGWVRNCPDGSVEAQLQGAPESVERVIEFCRHGPRRAQVQRAEIHECACEPHHGFEVR